MISIKDGYKKIQNDYSTSEILKEINLKIEENELIAITGPSGSGKTTLLNIIGMIDFFSQGTYQFQEVSITVKNMRKLRKKNFSYILQNFGLINDYTVKENIEVPLLFSNINHKEREKIVSKITNELSISNLLNKNIYELSGGEQQRVAIARALVANPKVILADEPTGSLDSENGRIVLELLLSAHKMGKTVIIVTHDQSIADQCERVINVKDGKIIKVKG